MMLNWTLNDPRLSILRKLRLIVENRLMGRRTGDYLSVVAGSGNTFDGHREYLPGDDFRRIDHTASHRLPGNRMVVRRMIQDTSLPVMVVVDGSPSMEFGPDGVRKSDVAMAVAGSLAFIMSERHNPVGQMLAKGDTELQYMEPRVHDDIHLLRQLDNLLNHEGEEGRAGNLGYALENVSRVFRQQGVIFVVSDIANLDEYKKPYSLLATSGHRMVSVQVVHSVEKGEIPSLLDGKLLNVKDPSVLGEQKLMHISKKGRKDYWDSRQEHMDDVEKFHRRANCDYLVLDTNENWVDALYMHLSTQHLRKKGVRYA